MWIAVGDRQIHSHSLYSNLYIFRAHFFTSFKATLTSTVTAAAATGTVAPPFIPQLVIRRWFLLLIPVLVPLKAFSIAFEDGFTITNVCYSPPLSHQQKKHWEPSSRSFPINSGTEQGQSLFLQYNRFFGNIFLLFCSRHRIESHRVPFLPPFTSPRVHHISSSGALLLLCHYIYDSSIIVFCGTVPCECTFNPSNMIQYSGLLYAIPSYSGARTGGDSAEEDEEQNAECMKTKGL